MDVTSFNTKKMNQIVKQTIGSIDDGRNKIFDIAESVRTECKNIENQLEEVKHRAVKVIKEVDEIEIAEKNSRRKLLHVSKNFKEHTEDEIKVTYEEAKNLQVKIHIKRKEEQELIQERTSLEQRLKATKEIAHKAEELISKVGLAMSCLTDNLQDVVEHLEDVEYRQAIAVKVIKAQEDERQRIAREIHDGPAQSMANAVLKAELCNKLMDRDGERAKGEINNLKGIVRDSLKDIRKIIYDLRPMALDDLGLVPTLEQFILKYKQDSPIDLDFIYMGNTIEVNSTVQLVVFRIVQEALNNIRKHSNAQNAVVKIEFTDRLINLIITDDGDGFNMKEKLESNKLKKDGGFGLFIMQERVELLKGKFNIRSSVGIGTSIRVCVPIKKECDPFNEN
ncbi:MAG: sensor histidine kinase [Anaeromicrobium sp.]|jgi:two-component system sensor histidine kinase DegS|uniref:sensor histidine kinase n=1 Tax=Anaeromicrobium sp. TaxID=1929132 RepID=UPI0025D9FF76|nr:sensor histidine kinase [Anaeromicrobium sp.]MCT4595946.1 sensor histidine kinase [Anaeromicrobium sp.]